MIARGWGRIINFSSAASLHPPGPLNSAYGTSKVALNQFTRHLAAELAGTGVTANVIHPGEVKTDMWATIRAAAETAGPLAEPLRAWAESVERTGGDDPQKAVDLVLELIDEKSVGTSGQFLWIADGTQRPLASW
jgi:NAD(P)-dependent dehydrogenase (short-subunit alcohol dehydrogenase family)